MKSSGWGAPFHAPLSYTKSDGDIKLAEYSEPHLAMGMCAGSGLCFRSRGSELSVRTWGLPATTCTCTQHVNTYSLSQEYCLNVSLNQNARFMQ